MKQFDRLMNTDTVSASIRCFSDKKTRRAFPLNEFIERKTVLSILKEKTPQAKAANTNFITEVKEDTMTLHRSIFEEINAETVLKSILKKHRMYGHSSLDTCDWRRMLTHFN